MTLRPHAPKTKPCTVCLKPFLPSRPMQQVCSPRCAHRKVKLTKDKEREEFKKRREAIKTIPQLIREAQVEFNAAIRERDKDKPCISCGRPLRTQAGGATGGDFDCGHFRSTGSAPHLRFDPRNAHGQCKHCNRYLAGNVVAYRAGLIGRIGLQEVEAIEASNEVHKWGRTELIEVRKRNAEWRKELQRG